MIKLIREMKSKWYAGKDVIKLMILSSLFSVCVMFALTIFLVYEYVRLSSLV